MTVNSQDIYIINTITSREVLGSADILENIVEGFDDNQEILITMGIQEAIYRLVDDIDVLIYIDDPNRVTC